MPLELFAYDMLSGGKLTPLPFSKASWKVTTNADGSVTCTVPVREVVSRKLKIWETTSLARNGIVAVADDIPTEGGPIWKRTYSAKAGTIDFTSGGIRSYLDRRVVVPVDARGKPLVLANGAPDTSLDTTINNLSYGTIGKRAVQLAALWPNGAIPLVYQADEVAAGLTKTVAAVDLKTVASLISDLSGLENGPDFAFRPRWNANQTGIYHEMTFGTMAVPRLGQTDPSLTIFRVGAPKGGGFDLEIDEDATALATTGWAVGGSGDDKVIAALSDNTYLKSLGYPAMDGTVTGLTDITRQATMQSYANQVTALGRFASSFWSMSVRANEKGTPMLGRDYWLGDLATVTIDASEPVLPPGDTVRRIAGISGDEKGKAYSIDFAEALV